MNISKQALILTLSLVGLTNMNYVGLQPAQAEKPATQGQQESKKAANKTRQQEHKENHQSKPHQSTDSKEQQKPETETENHRRDSRENKLNLTDAQKAQIKQIQVETRQKINAVYTPEQQEKLSTANRQRQRVNLNLSPDQKARIQAIQQDAKRQMQGILTPEQQKLQGQHSSEGKHQQASTKSASKKR